jgi:cell division septation protein DedD
MTEGVSGTLHRVLLGPYSSRERAETVADSVATLGDLNPRVREVDAGSSP